MIARVTRGERQARCMRSTGGWLASRRMGLRHTGQALPLMLCILTVCGAVWIASARLSHTAQMRVRLTHAADAAAYSGAVAQARSLNLLAYINRAQVAHQVAIAHLVTLTSFVQLSETLAETKRAKNPPVFVVELYIPKEQLQAYRESHHLLDAGRDFSEPAKLALLRAIHEHDVTVHEVLALTAASVAGHMNDYRDQTMLHVLRENFPEMDARFINLASSGADGPTAVLQLETSDHSSSPSIRSLAGNGPGQFRQLVEEAVSRYRFAHRRDWTVQSGASVKSMCEGRLHELRRRGHTRLDEKGHWIAQDSLSFHKVLGNKISRCYHRENPLGWGRTRSADAARPEGSRPPSRFPDEDYWVWATRHTDWDIFEGTENFYADTNAEFDAWQTTARGLPDYYDLTESGRDLGLHFSIVLRLLRASPPGVGASQTSGANVLDMLRLPGAITVNAAANTYYHQPAEHEAHVSDRANLFRPRWQARLAHAGDQPVPSP